MVLTAPASGRTPARGWVCPLRKIAALFGAPVMAAALSARVTAAPAMPQAFSGRVLVIYEDGVPVGMTLE